MRCALLSTILAYKRKLAAGPDPCSARSALSNPRTSSGILTRGISEPAGDVNQAFFFFFLMSDGLNKSLFQDLIAADI